MTEQLFLSLPIVPGGFGAILADPPWSWRSWSPKGEGRSAKNHYDVLNLDALKTLPVASIAAEDCMLFLWVLESMPGAERELFEAWGFIHKTTAFAWEKVTQDGRPAFGCGYYTRANIERCLLATRGKPRRLDRGVPQLIRAPRGCHSEKPPEVRERIERLVAGPYCELFCRGPGRSNWAIWGVEAAPER